MPVWFPSENPCTASSTSKPPTRPIRKSTWKESRTRKATKTFCSSRYHWRSRGQGPDARGQSRPSCLCRPLRMLRENTRLEKSVYSHWQLAAGRCFFACANLLPPLHETHDLKNQ